MAFGPSKIFEGRLDHLRRPRTAYDADVRAHAAEVLPKALTRATADWRISYQAEFRKTFDAGA